MSRYSSGQRKGAVFLLSPMGLYKHGMSLCRLVGSRINVLDALGRPGTQTMRRNKARPPAEIEVKTRVRPGFVSSPVSISFLSCKMGTMISVRGNLML